MVMIECDECKLRATVFYKFKDQQNIVFSCVTVFQMPQYFNEDLIVSDKNVTTFNFQIKVCLSARRYFMSKVQKGTKRPS